MDLPSYKIQSGLYFSKRRKFLKLKDQQVYINIHTDKFTEVIGGSCKHCFTDMIPNITLDRIIGISTERFTNLVHAEFASIVTHFFTESTIHQTRVVVTKNFRNISTHEHKNFNTI